jgi:hypothetical protein
VPVQELLGLLVVLVVACQFPPISFTPTSNLRDYFP